MSDEVHDGREEWVSPRLEAVEIRLEELLMGY